MKICEILSKVDHTLLSPEASWDSVRRLCDEGILYQTASVCIPPAFVKEAKTYVGDRLPICTVIGFPNGYSTPEVKVFETKDAIANGADEIDMVIHIGSLKEKRYDAVFNEICAVREACAGHILKVIIETALLNREEKIKMCEIVSDSGADYIKTSTGFSKGGATKEDIMLMAASSAPHLKIKAAGGIASVEDAVSFIELGASRLGTSRIVSLVKNMNQGEIDHDFQSTLSDSTY